MRLRKKVLSREEAREALRNILRRQLLERVAIDLATEYLDLPHGPVFGSLDDVAVGGSWTRLHEYFSSLEVASDEDDSNLETLVALAEALSKGRR